MSGNYSPHSSNEPTLEIVRSVTGRLRAGRLRLYFSYADGYHLSQALLDAGAYERDYRRDIVIGTLDEKLLADKNSGTTLLEKLPPMQVWHGNQQVDEFDLKAALRRKPSLILIDHLAHTNASGARNVRRWQDIEELLNSGIDVYTTVSVRHIESLGKAVANITGQQAVENIPERLFTTADEIIFVDASPDDVIVNERAQGLRPPPNNQPVQPSNKQFRIGELIDLRELALRHITDRVSADRKALRSGNVGAPAPHGKAGVLVCVGPHHTGDLLNTAERIARRQGVHWHAIHVRVAAGIHDATSQQHLTTAMRLAESLGASTMILSGDDIARRICEYARMHGIPIVILGNRVNRIFIETPWNASIARRIAAYGPELEIVQISRGSDAPTKFSFKRLRLELHQGWTDYLGAAMTSGATTIAALLMASIIDLPNLVGVFLLSIMVIATRWGAGPAVLSSILNAISFAYFLSPPRFDFGRSDLQYILLAAVMAVVGLITSSITARLRHQNRLAAHREDRAKILYDFAKALSGALDLPRVIETSDAYITQAFQANSVLLLPDHELNLVTHQSSGEKISIDLALAQRAFDRAVPTGFGTDTLPDHPLVYIPLKAPMRTRGLLAIQPRGRDVLAMPEQRQLLETFAALIAIALERVHYVTVARDALLGIESRELRESLLTALSQDLRTPLTVLIELADSLTLSRSASVSAKTELADAIRDEARRMSLLVGNLLDMARIENGEIRIIPKLQGIDAVIQSALATMKGVLAEHVVELTLATDLPHIHFDAALIERVLVNLLENTARHTPSGTRLEISTQASQRSIRIILEDNGPGLPDGSEETVFDKYARGIRAPGAIGTPGSPGFGLGLAICRAIIDAHHGTIHAGVGTLGGARFTITLPIQERSRPIAL